MKNKATLLLFLQLLFMLLFIVSSPWFARNIYLLTVELLAIALGAWAIIHMVSHSTFSGSPVPAKNAHLLTTGPYTYIRNPMYTAIILGFGALLVNSFTWVRFTIFLLETVVLLKKISVEEIFLTKKFPGYADYKSRTRRLIPFIY